MTTEEKILTCKLIAISRGADSSAMPEMCEAILRGGIHMLEITFDHTSDNGIANTIACIRAVKQQFGDRISVGAGTVLSAEEVRLAADAGAEYMISPNVNAAVIAETKKLGLVSIPGAMTPTEAVNAVDAGADFVKLFPAAALGLSYFKAIVAPLKHIRFLPTGGITPELIPEFMKLGAAGFGVGGNLTNAQLVREGKFDVIEKAAHAFTEAVNL